MEKDDYGHTRLEQLERLLETPETVTPEEREAWMRDEAFCDLFRLAMDTRRSLLGESPVPDVKEAYRSFRRKRMQGRAFPGRFLWLSVAAAACILLCIGLFLGRQDDGLPEAVRVYVAESRSDEVVLSVGEKPIPLAGAADSLMASLSLKWDKEKELRYGAEAAEDAAWHTLATPQGKDFHIVLSDGTRVWLNAESSLTYPPAFAGALRTVRLQGEAYFEVAPDKAHPFVVECGDLKTTVLGTSFNVRRYRQEEPHVTLAEGSVSVTHGGRQLALQPGQDATLSADGSLTAREVDVQAFICWKDGLFYFDGVPFERMMEDIGRWYKADVIFVGTRHLGDLLHFHAEKSWTLDEIVLQINRLSDATVRIEGHVLTVE